MSDTGKKWDLQVDCTEQELERMLSCEILNINGHPFWSRNRVGLLLIKFASKQIEKNNTDVWRMRHLATELVKVLADRGLLDGAQIPEAAQTLLELVPKILGDYDRANKIIIDDPNLDDLTPSDNDKQN